LQGVPKQVIADSSFVVGTTENGQESPVETRLAVDLLAAAGSCRDVPSLARRAKGGDTSKNQKVKNKN
jgi:hypothetical protein